MVYRSGRHGEVVYMGKWCTWVGGEIGMVRKEGEVGWKVRGKELEGMGGN